MRVRGPKKLHFGIKKIDKKEPTPREEKSNEKERKKGGKREAKVIQNSTKTTTKKEMEKGWRFENFGGVIWGAPGGPRGPPGRGIGGV